MVYAVSVGAGYSKMTILLPTPQEAMAEARNQVEHDARDVTITITATGETMTPEQFASHLTQSAANRLEK